MKILQQIIFGFYLLTYFVICLSIGLFGYEFVSYYARAEKIAFLPSNTILIAMSGIAVFVTIILALLSRWIIPRGQKSRVILLLAVWIIILGGYKGLKLPDNYEVDRSRYIVTNVTGFDKQQNTITEQRRSQKLRDVPMRPENTDFEGERYIKSEVIRQFDLPLKLRFAAGNLESKKVDTIPVKINCISETAPTKTDIVHVKTDNMLVFYNVPSEFSRAIIEIPAINSDIYPGDDHVNLRVFSNRVVKGYEAMFVNIGKCALVVSLLYICVALICLLFDVSPCPLFENIDYWHETKNIVWNIGLDIVNLCRYFWLKKWLILLSSVIGLICLGIACFNYSRMSEFPIEHSKSNLLWAARMIWSITVLIAFLIINNWHKATKIFWLHFTIWSTIFLLHWLVVNPGYFSNDSYYSIFTIISLDVSELVLWGHCMGLYRLLAMVAVSQVPYWGFFVILQALFSAAVIGIIAQLLSKVIKFNRAIILLNIILFLSVPFQCYTLGYVREVPYCLFLFLAAISLFLIILKKKKELEVQDWLLGIIAIFCISQFRADGLLAVLAFFCIIFIRLVNSSWQFPYKNFIRPLFCFLVVTIILTTYVGNSSKETSKYGNIILKRAIVDMFLLEHRIQDSDTDETKSLKESHIPTYRNFRLPDRLIFENPVLFLTSRLKFFLLHANVFARGHDGINDVRDNVNKIYPQTQTVFDYVLSNHLIPEKQGYPDTKLFKLSKNLRNNKSLIGRITWSFLPSLLLLAVVVMLYPFFPASASVAFLFLSVVPPVFFLAANGSPIYYLAVHYGGILILPFMIFEFQYRRQQFKKKVL